MERPTAAICGLCSNYISAKNYEVIKTEETTMINVILPKLRIDNQTRQVMCNVCSLKLSTAYKFKLKCLQTDSTITSHIGLKKIPPIDLIDVYKEENGVNVEDDTKICRLCIEPVLDEFIPVHDVKTDILQKYIPEVNFNVTKDPVICKSCLDFVLSNNSFIDNCYYAQKKAKEHHERIDNPCFDLYIKKENEPDNKKRRIVINTDEDVINFVGIKEEIHDENLFLSEEIEEESYGEMLLSIEEIEIKSENIEEIEDRLSPHETETNGQTIDTMQVVEHDPTNPSTPKGTIHQNTSDTQLYKCNSCDYITTRKESLKYHIRKHKTDNQQLYECHVCGYKMKYRSLRQHMIVHSDASEIHWYTCEVCQYKSKRKSDLKLHMRIHKDPSEVEWYNCELCDYTTKNKNSLKRHILIHKDESEIEWYQCDVDLCDYKAKCKYDLKKHMLVHKSGSEVSWFKCDLCHYKSKRKWYLKKHSLVHRKSSRKSSK